MTALIALSRASSKDAFHRKASDPQPDAMLQAKIVASLDRIRWDTRDPAQ